MTDLLNPWIEKHYYWRPEFADDDIHPNKVNDSLGSGTYQTFPYLIFVKDDRERVHLISDGTLDLIVTPDSSPATTSQASFQIAPLPPGDANQWAAARIHVDTQTMQFRVTGTLESSELSPGRYVQIKLRTGEGGQEILGDVFSSTEQQFYAVQVGYDVTKLTLENPGANHKKNVFDTPAKHSRKYDTFGKFVIPFGWRFANDSQAWGDTKTTVISNDVELNQSAMTTYGSSQSVGLFGLKLGEEESNTGTNQIDTIRKSELTLTTTKNTMTNHAVVLDKTNVTLSEVFYQAFTDLMMNDHPSEDDFATFCNVVGTHYSNASTFGARVYLISRYTTDQIVEISNQGIDVGQSLSAGLDFKYEGMNIASASLGESSKSVNDQKTKLESILGGSLGYYHAIGSETNGQPTESSLVPVMLDLRLISDLLAPPFFYDWNIIGLHPESWRSRLASYIQSYAYYKIDAQSERVARFHRLTFTSNRVMQTDGVGNPGMYDYHQLEHTTEIGGMLSVKDTPDLFIFSLSVGSQQLTQDFGLHDSLIVTADGVTMAIVVPITNYITVLDIPHANSHNNAFSLHPWQNYDMDEEAAYLLNHGGKARPYSFILNTNTPEREIMLPYLVLTEPVVNHPHAIRVILAGYASFSCTSVDSAQALGLA